MCAKTFKVFVFLAALAVSVVMYVRGERHMRVECDSEEFSGPMGVGC